LNSAFLYFIFLLISAMHPAKKIMIGDLLRVTP